MSRNPLERSVHPSKQQIAALLKYLEQHPELAKGFPRQPMARNRMKKQWELLAPRLNGIGKSVKTWQQWVKYWSDKRASVKRKVALREAALQREGSADTVTDLTELEERVLSLTSQEYVVEARSPVPISCDNSCNEIEINSTDGETQLIDHSEVVLFVSPASLLQEGSQQPRSPSVILTDSPTPSHFPSPPPQPPIYRRTFTPVVTSQPQFRNTEMSHHRGPRPPHPSSAYSATSAPSATSVLSPEANTSRQRRSQFARLTERFLKVEEQRLELDRKNTGILETVAGIASQLMERDFERERIFAQALGTVGDALKLLAETLRKNEAIDHI